MAYATELINDILKGITGIRTGIHICRGNWSTKEDVFLSGDYTPLVDALGKMNVDQYILEYSTPRAGEIDAIGNVLGSKEIGLGVVNPRTIDIESPETIVAQVEKTLKYFNSDSIFLNPDCGFGCFADNCVNNEETAYRKLETMVKASNILKERYQ